MGVEIRDLKNETILLQKCIEAFSFDGKLRVRYTEKSVIAWYSRLSFAYRCFLGEVS